MISPGVLDDGLRNLVGTQTYVCHELVQQRRPLTAARRKCGTDLPDAASRYGEAVKVSFDGQGGIL